jgi:hypothetical protein
VLPSLHDRYLAAARTTRDGSNGSLAELGLWRRRGGLRRRYIALIGFDNGYIVAIDTELAAT